MQTPVVKPVEDKNEWNSFVASHTSETFHQSWEWGEVYKQDGHKVWFLGAFNNGTLIAASLAIKIAAKRGTFLLVPHGPIFANTSMQQSALAALTERFVKLGKEEGCSFVRIAPIIERTRENENLFKNAGFRRAPIFVQSEQSWVLDVTPEPQIVLQNMRKSTRYILKNKDSYGVRCERSTSADDINLFCSLYKKTVANQGFFGQGVDFITKEYLSFLKNNGVSLYFAYYEDQPIAAALVIEQNDTGFYHYGASIRLEKYIPAPHILQWFVIQDLKSRGFKRYNFWGIAPENKPKHPWAGLSLFKKGFGGEEHAYVKTQDYILNPSYWFSWVIETIRSTKRGY